MLLKKNNAQIGKGMFVALVLLFLVELIFHNDNVLYNYRSVFAAGRLMDKVQYVSQSKLSLIFLGNSRIDNGIDTSIAENLIRHNSMSVFNLGIPGSNGRVFQGVAKYIASNKSVKVNKDQKPYIMIGLDPELFTLNEELGYSVFFADRDSMWEQKDYYWLLASIFRLWGFSNNLKGLREPEKLLNFFKASFYDVPAWGGDVSINKGFRAKDGVLTKATQENKNLFNKKVELDKKAINYFMQSIDDFQSKGIEVAVFFPVIYRHSGVALVSTLFKSDDLDAITKMLKQKNVKFIKDITVEDFTAQDFFNPGHLNTQGAEKFTRKIMINLKNDWMTFAGLL